MSGSGLIQMAKRCGCCGEQVFWARNFCIFCLARRIRGLECPHEPKEAAAE